MTNDHPTEGGLKKRLGGVLRWALNIAILLGCAVAARKYLNGAEILDALRGFNWLYGVAILALSSAYLLLKGYRFVVLLRPVSDAPAWTLIKAYCAGQPAAMIPGGIAARAALLDQVGVPVTKSTGPIIYSSLADQASFITGVLFVALWNPQVRQPAAVLLGIVGALILLLFVPPVRNLLSRLLLALLRRFKLEEQGRLFFLALRDVTRPRVLLGAYLITAVAFALAIAMLDLTLRGLGETLSYATQLLAYTLPTMMASLLPTPGGAGVTEAGMALYMADHGLNANVAAAAIVIFRIGSVFWQAIFGGLIYFTLWCGRNELGRPEPVAASTIEGNA